MKNNAIKETKSELKKVIWPSKKDVINGTAVVVAMVVIVGIIIVAFDFVSSALIGKIIGEDIRNINPLVNVEEHDHEHDHDHVHEEDDAQTPVEDSEPTIDNIEVAE